jgi:hypothetical protein
MPNAVQSNPLGINAAQGNEVYSSPLIIPFAADPAGNTQTITGMTTANPTVITTTAAHGFISGQKVLVNTSTAFVATGTLPTSQAYVATVLSATTFSIPFNYTGTYTSGGAVFQNFQPGQLAILQNWSGTASGAASAPAYPTVALPPLTTASKALVGVIIGYNTLGGVAPPPVYGQSLVVQVQTQGICQAYVDATTSSSPTNLSQSVATPGAGKTLAATTGINVGIILQNVTVTSAYLPQLCEVFVRLS